jgi:hypothetical protein
MKSVTTFALGVLALAALGHVQSAHGQTAAQPKRAPLASSADVEPAVDVSEPRVALIDVPPLAAPVPAATAAVPAAPANPGAPGEAAQNSSGSAQGRSPPKPAAAPNAGTPTPVAANASSTRPAAPAPNSRAMDTLDLGTTSITGNQELPKVLYIVPWKKSDLGDLVGRPVNTLLDEVLEPVDPEVFQRHLSYYDALYGKGQKGKE